MGKHSTIFYIFLGFVLFICLIIYYRSDTFDLNIERAEANPAQARIETNTLELEIIFKFNNPIPIEGSQIMY
jgi:hypothetical protein